MRLKKKCNQLVSLIYNKTKSNKVAQLADQKIEKNFLLIGRIPLSWFYYMEKICFIWGKPILEQYVKTYVGKMDTSVEKFSTKKRVFFLANNMGLWNLPISSHIKIIADIAKIYNKNDIEVEVVFSNHPFKSDFFMQDFKFNSFFNVKKEMLIDAVYSEAYKVSGIRKNDNFKVTVLNSYEDKHTLHSFMQSVEDFFKERNITQNDLIFGVNGIFSSFVFHRFLEKIHGKKILFLFNYNNQVTKDMQITYDKIMTQNIEKTREKLKNNELSYVKLRGLPGPFFWEKELSHFEENESDLLKNIEKTKPCYIFVVASRSVGGRIEKTYANILNSINIKYQNSLFLFIGGEKKVIKKMFNRYDINLDSFEVLEFSKHYYSLMSTINSTNNAVYILPKTSGSGYTTLLAAFAGIPVVLFEGNDSKFFMPNECFVQSQEEYISRVEKLIKDKSYRESSIANVHKCFEQQLQDAEKFYTNLLEDSKSTNLGDLGGK